MFDLFIYLFFEFEDEKCLKSGIIDAEMCSMRSISFVYNLPPRYFAFITLTSPVNACYYLFVCDTVRKSVRQKSEAAASCSGDSFLALWMKSMDEWKAMEN